MRHKTPKDLILKDSLQSHFIDILVLFRRLKLNIYNEDFTVDQILKCAMIHTSTLDLGAVGEQSN